MIDSSPARPANWIIALRILLTAVSLLPIAAFAFAALGLSGSPFGLLVAAPPLALGVHMCTSRNSLFVWAVCLMQVALLVAYGYFLWALMGGKPPGR